jgi:hypothetical protein
LLPLAGCTLLVGVGAFAALVGGALLLLEAGTWTGYLDVAVLGGTLLAAILGGGLAAARAGVTLAAVFAAAALLDGVLAAAPTAGLRDACLLGTAWAAVLPGLMPETLFEGKTVPGAMAPGGAGGLV